MIINELNFLNYRESELNNYKYKGSDKSLLYKYIFSPIAEKVVSIIPEWIAFLN